MCTVLTIQTRGRRNPKIPPPDYVYYVLNEIPRLVVPQGKNGDVYFSGYNHGCVDQSITLRPT